MEKRNSRLSVVLSAVALVVAIAAAYFAWMQVDVSRVHNRLSVMPILQLTPYLEGPGGKNGIYLSNDGLGPAIIEGFSVKVGEVVASGFEEDRWSEMLGMTEALPDCFAAGWPKANTALKASAEESLIRITQADIRSTCYGEMVKLVGGRPLEIRVDYRSMYGEKKQLVADSRIVSKKLEKLYRALVSKSTQ